MTSKLGVESFVSKSTATITDRVRPDSLSQELQDQLTNLEIRKVPNSGLRFPVSKSSLRKFCVSLLATFVLLLVAEGLARAIICGINPIQFGSAEFDAKMRLANTPVPAGKPCLYFVGSSHSSRAVYADLIAAQLQQAGHDVVVRNIACSGSFPREQLMILEHALKTSPGPAMVISECNQSGFSMSESFLNSYSRHFISSLYMKNMRSDWPIFKRFDLWMKHNIYLVRYRTILKERLVQLPANIFSPAESIWKKQNTGVTAAISPAGWAPDYLVPAKKVHLNFGMVRRLLESNVFDPAGDDAKKRDRYPLTKNFFDLAKQRNLKIAMLWLPLHPRYQAYCNKEMQTNDEAVQTRMENAAKLENCPLIDVHDYGIEEDFTDSFHITAGGAVEVSKMIADKLLAKKEIFLKPLTDDAR
jgi:hypothetical protein